MLYHFRSLVMRRASLLWLRFLRPTYIATQEIEERSTLRMNRRTNGLPYLYEGSQGRPRALIHQTPLLWDGQQLKAYAHCTVTDQDISIERFLPWGRNFP